MKASKEAIRIIKKYEGFRSKAYLCPAGVWTIGYGFTQGVKPGDVMTQGLAEQRLSTEIEIRAKELYQLLHTRGIVVGQNQFDALLSFAYNVGLNAFKKSTMLKCLMSKDLAGAAVQFDRWVYGPNKVKLRGLIARRSEEKQLFLS